MVTTAARSRDYMRKIGYIAECVEHRRGSFIRVDLFGFADVIAYKASEGIILVQAYHESKASEHEHLIPTKNEKIKQWLMSGGKFQHHLWYFKTKHGRKHWFVTPINLTLKM